MKAQWDIMVHMRGLTVKRAWIEAMVLVLVSGMGGICLGVQYTVTDLGPNGSNDGAVTGINNNGQVVGYTSIDYYAPMRAFLWTASGGMQNLATPPGAFSTYATGINNSGQIAGYVYDTNGSTSSAYLWTTSGGMQDLGTLFYQISCVTTGINNSGEVVGWSQGSGPPTNGFTWTATDGMQFLGLGTLSGTFYPHAINNSGHVAGGMYNDNGFLWAPGLPGSLYDSGLFDLGALPLDPDGGNASVAFGVNDSDQVVGDSHTTGPFNASWHAFLWTVSGGMQDLGTLGGLGGGVSRANGINNNGQVVGWSSNNSSGNSAFLYTATGGMQDLNDLIDPNSGLFLENAEAINDLGQIVGIGGAGGWGGNSHFFLLTPVPEPATLSLLALGALALIRRRRKVIPPGRDIE